jgi:hypothetical protein
MRKTLFFLILSLLSLTACQNNQSSSNPIDINQPLDTANFTKIQWKDTLIDFGTISMGDSIQMKFVCTNTGNKPLFITSVRASCGCTVPAYTESAILPGAEGAVTASFNSNRSHPGEVFKTVYVSTNTPGGDNYVLSFKGKIVQPVQ